MRLYLMGGVVLAFLALGLLTLWYRGEAIDAAGERDRAVVARNAAVDANKAQQAALDALVASQKANDALLADLASDVATINAQLTETNAALSGLKDSDETVRDYLNTPVPDSLLRLYVNP